MTTKSGAKDKATPPRIVVIPIARHPTVGKWNFDDSAPLEGARGSDPVPVILSGKLSWAHYWEDTNDGGKSVAERGWTSDDPYGQQDRTVRPKFWLVIGEGRNER